VIASGAQIEPVDPDEEFIKSSGELPHRVRTMTAVVLE